MEFNLLKALWVGRVHELLHEGEVLGPSGHPAPASRL
jgi:hypothetical protein